MSKKFTEKLTSRKWLLTVAVAAILAFNGAWSELVQVTIGFLAVQGGIDAYTSYKSET